MEKKYCIREPARDDRTLMLQETLFHNANGYLGVRGSLEEGVPDSFRTMRGMYLNGLYDVIPMKQAESLYGLAEEKDTMLNVADLQTVRISLAGEAFSMLEGEILRFSRTLDMDAGTTERRLLWRSPLGRETELCFTRMASFRQKQVFTIACEITPVNYSGTAEILSEHRGLVKNYANPNDPRLAADGGVLLRAGEHRQRDGATFLTSSTSRSGFTVCTAVRHSLSGAYTEETDYDPGAHAWSTRFRAPLRAQETLRLVKYTVTTDSGRASDPAAEAHACMNAVYGRLDELCAAQREYLAEFWQTAELEIDAQDDSSLAMQFNLYALLQSCGSDGLCATASKGLSGEGYEGHYFWDTEIYLMPFLTRTCPALARNQLRYRFRTLEQAKENARLMGHRRGALYPWRTISGRECSGFFPAGSAQYHINGDIANALVQYYLTTGDMDYLAGEGAQLLVETARLWLDTGCWSGGKFRIHDVTGPDEYTCIVNNNYYTNACAKANLYWAFHAAELLRAAGRWDAAAAATGVTQEELEDFRRAAEGMYLPYDEALGINPQDDSFLQKPEWDFAATPQENYPLLLHYHPLQLYRHQVCKQADTVLAYHLFPKLESRETMRRSFAYYEKRTTHDSSLSNCVFSTVASELGLREKAWSYFGESIRSDLRNSHGNTGDGVHTANMGGSYMMIVDGFAGLRVSEDGLELRPFVPAAWNGYRFRIRYRGSVLEIRAERESCTVRLVSGAALALRLYGEECTLETVGASVTRKGMEQ